MLFTVYDKKGEPFEVIPSVAKRLVIQDGWSMDAPKTPVPAPAAAPVVEPAPTAHIANPQINPEG